MSEHLVDERPWEVLRQALHTNKGQQVRRVLDMLPPSGARRALLHLAPDEREQLLTLAGPEAAADLIEEVPDEQAGELLEGLPAEEAASILEELDSDDQADVVAELKVQDAEAILAEMAPEDAKAVRDLVEHDPDTAGGLMVTEVFSFLDNETVGVVLARLAAEDQVEHYRLQHAYVVDASKRLAGVISLRNLLTSKRTSLLSEIMVKPVAVGAGEGLQELRDLFERYDFLGIPVVNPEGILLGVVARSAVADAWRDRAEAESLKVQGIVGDELRSMPFVIRSRRRLSWLSINIVLNIIAAGVIALYEDTLAAVIALAVFLPMVSDMSGCSGNQAVAVSLRELALGLTKPIDVFRVWRKEISVGMLNGLALGMLIAAVAWAWKGNPYLGLVIGVALCLNTMVAVSIGGTLPLLLKRFGVDPAVASGPLLTTVTDLAGFFFVLSLATLFIPLLAPAGSP